MSTSAKVYPALSKNTDDGGTSKPQVPLGSARGRLSTRAPSLRSLALARDDNSYKQHASGPVKPCPDTNLAPGTSRQARWNSKLSTIHWPLGTALARGLLVRDALVNLCHAVGMALLEPLLLHAGRRLAREQHLLRRGGTPGLRRRLGRVVQIEQHQVTPVLRILRAAGFQQGFAQFLIQLFEQRSFVLGCAGTLGDRAVAGD